MNDPVPPAVLAPPDRSSKLTTHTLTNTPTNTRSLAPAADLLPDPGNVSFARRVARARARGELLVQPRLGFSDPAEMRRGLIATRNARAATVGTITLDSYTRVLDYPSAAKALAKGTPLNGFPIVNHGPQVTRQVLDGVRQPDFPVQVRHGSARPFEITEALLRAGLDATEGGPISYCLPYGRVPLRVSIHEWSRTCRLLARTREHGVEPHLESFGGCMLGQLCPPSLLIAISILECMFFISHGVRSVSASYAQQTNKDQDIEALAALRTLAGEFLAGTDWHVVVYTYMGVYPQSPDGALRLLRDSAELAVRGGAARLIVKTRAEASRIPTVAENIEALELAAATARACPPCDAAESAAGGAVLAEARALVEAVLDLHTDVGAALLRGMERGLIDVPYCLHPDNRGHTRSHLDAQGRIQWSATGSLPIRASTLSARSDGLTSSELLASLCYVRNRYDRPGETRPRPGVGAAVPTEVNH